MGVNGGSKKAELIGKIVESCRLASTSSPCAAQVKFGNDSLFRNVVCSCIIVIETITIIVWIIEHKLYLLSIKYDYGFFKPFSYRLGIEPSSGDAGKESASVRLYYRQPGSFPWRWFGGTQPRVASYAGSIDSDGRPHGDGVWQDSAPRGEWHFRQVDRSCGLDPNVTRLLSR